jgi:hypothetical protein
LDGVRSGAEKRSDHPTPSGGAPGSLDHVLRTDELPEVLELPATGWSVARERHLRLRGEVDERRSAHVYSGALDCAADERPGVVARVVVYDRSAPSLPMFSPSPASENLPGWVLIFCSATFVSPMCSVSVPSAGIVSPSRPKRGVPN